MCALRTYIKLSIFRKIFLRIEKTIITFSILNKFFQKMKINVYHPLYKGNGTNCQRHVRAHFFLTTCQIFTIKYQQYMPTSCCPSDNFQRL